MIIKNKTTKPQIVHHTTFESRLLTGLRKSIGLRLILQSQTVKIPAFCLFPGKVQNFPVKWNTTEVLPSTDQMKVGIGIHIQARVFLDLEAY